MSKDKHRSWERQRKLLEKLALRPNGGLVIHIEGGLALDNPDLQKILKQRFARIDRFNYMGPGYFAYAAKRFRMTKDNPYHDCYSVKNITRAIITPKGLAALAGKR